jgi:hypothetical protein
MTKPFLPLLLAPIALLSACTGAGHQSVPRPTGDVSAELCRVYVAREDTVAGSIRSVRVFDGDTEIGLIAEDEFLCWDRRPVRGVGRLFFEGVGLQTEVENVFDLPRDPGTTSYYAIRVTREQRKPEIERVSEEAGRALMAARTPARMQ